MTVLGRDRAVAMHLHLALAAIGLTLTFGVLSVLHYIPSISVMLGSLGLGLPSLRPLHTTFAHTWIFAANLAFIYYFLSRQRRSGLDVWDRRRFLFHTVCWIVGGVGVLVTLLMGVTSGREYLGFRPIFSAVFLLGWIAFAWTFFKYIASGFWRRPVYVYMWAIGILYFMYTFTEAHAYLLPLVNRFPIVDLQLQWKAAGSLVGSFNFLVYGSLMYLGERISGDESYGQSRTAFLLFGVGCLNSFTNFGHHTYHIPQTHAVKWIAFIVSMLEIIIVFRVMSDILKLRGVKSEAGDYSATSAFMTSAKWWTLAMIFGGIVISIPSWNSIIHGTHVVVGHAMGAEFGIDSMVLFAVVTYLLVTLWDSDVSVVQRINSRAMRPLIIALNVSAVALVSWLMGTGIVSGLLRYQQRPAPSWIVDGRWVFVGAGSCLAVALVILLSRWVPLLVGIERRMSRTQTPTSVSEPSESA